MYASFASCYDSLTAGVNYPSRASYFSGAIEKHSGVKKGLLLDLCCGTGSLSLELRRLGWDVIGVDISEEMLALATQKACERPAASRPMFLRQDARFLDLYGTVDAAVCALDSINHLQNTVELRDLFARVSLFLATGGVFVFDVNSLYKHERVLSGQVFVYDEPQVYCVWQNSLCKDGVVDIALDFFSKTGQNTYQRSGERFSERFFSTEEITAAAEPYGFTLEAVYGEDSFLPPDEWCERLVYVMKNTTEHYTEL